MKKRNKNNIFFIYFLFILCYSDNSSAELAERENFIADLYFGAAYDNFSGPVEEYINYGDEETKWRFSGGVIFDYNLISRDELSLWVGGKSLRGVRSAEVDCTVSDPPVICSDINLTEDSVERGKYLLRNATSYEAGISFRLEWDAGFLKNAEAPGSLYLSYEVAGVAVDNDDDDVADINSINIGYIISNGKFRGSFLEYGRGQNDIFIDDSHGRSKIKARIVLNELSLFGLTESLPARFFIQTNLDADGGDGGDSIQTYVGFSMSFSELFASK
ncbi:hypothetical protein MHM87_19535 [Alteromonas sp. Cnat3-28]|uniref:hypothetical protein n=1 Tax=Alteromonas TaxID=226 RepID=UPI001EF5D7AB|nr:hypothetical protein [Alteromonas sp. Cnat3-28]MCG7647770.1 hypothetical protein [Alteromonas sp. Cnat3-28]